MMNSRCRRNTSSELVRCFYNFFSFPSRVKNAILNSQNVLESKDSIFTAVENALFLSGKKEREGERDVRYITMLLFGKTQK